MTGQTSIISAFGLTLILFLDNRFRLIERFPFAWVVEAPVVLSDNPTYKNQTNHRSDNPQTKN